MSTIIIPGIRPEISKMYPVMGKFERGGRGFLDLDVGQGNHAKNKKPQMNADKRRFVSLAPAYYKLFIRDQSEGYENHSN
ncbi:MAG: hypothetical protein OIN87_01835 [Candidatus Methanoperedens sp.]|nr:hypothetical protein [Candidatus Methanoperedens sp.]